MVCAPVTNHLCYYMYIKNQSEWTKSVSAFIRCFGIYEWIYHHYFILISASTRLLYRSTCQRYYHVSRMSNKFTALSGQGNDRDVGFKPMNKANTFVAASNNNNPAPFATPVDRSVSIIYLIKMKKEEKKRIKLIYVPRFPNDFVCRLVHNAYKCTVYVCAREKNSGNF
jgi:hypothetical protein